MLILHEMKSERITFMEIGSLQFELSKNDLIYSMYSNDTFKRKDRGNTLKCPKYNPIRGTFLNQNPLDYRQS